MSCSRSGTGSRRPQRGARPWTLASLALEAADEPLEGDPDRLADAPHLKEPQLDLPHLVLGHIRLRAPEQTREVFLSKAPLGSQLSQQPEEPVLITWRNPRPWHGRSVGATCVDSEPEYAGPDCPEGSP